jgi:nucleotide-binding universal stress UspA family protein
MSGPILFCYDGSAGSRNAMKTAGPLISRPADGFVLTVWVPVYARVMAAGSLAPMVLTDEAEIDEQEAAAAQKIADEGANLAKTHGYDLTPLAEKTDRGVAHAILEVADHFNVTLIVCGQKGRRAISTALLGSVSHALSNHARKPILIAPERA